MFDVIKLDNNTIVRISVNIFKEKLFNKLLKDKII